MQEPLDRRRFLALAGVAGASLAGCAAGTTGGKSAKSADTANTAGSANGVAAARAGATGPRRPTRHGPRSLQQAIRGHVFTRGAPGFAAAAQVFNTRFDGVSPAQVARPLDARDVRDAISFTVEHGLPVRARSGGHSYAGYSTLGGGVVLDLRSLNKIAVDKRAGAVRVGAGARLIDIYSALGGHGATIPGGSCPSVGISGVTLGGGMGLAGRRLGLTLDSLIAAEIVTADGTLQTVSKHSDPDLFWALRGGGGGNFGIVTAFTFRLHPMPAMAAHFNVSWQPSAAADALDAWQSWAPHTTDRITSILHLNSGPSISANGQYFGPSADLTRLLAPLLSVPGAILSVGDLPYVELQQYFAGCLNMPATCHTGGPTTPRSFNAHSDYVSRPLPAAGRAALVSAAASPGVGSVLFDCYGGALNRVAPEATAFVHREQLFCMQYYVESQPSGWIDNAWQAMRPYVSGQAYQNYIDPTLNGWQKAYYGRNLKRLEQIRKQVDPHHYFNFPQAIGR